MLKPGKLQEMHSGQYYYCDSRECSVVYFSGDGDSRFTIDDVVVAVFAKDPGSHVSVCYCFDWTRERIKREIEATGKSTAVIQIAKDIKAGRCDCDIKNPKGECCLGDVNQVVRDAKGKSTATS